MLVEEYFVLSISMNMGQSAVFITVTTERLLAYKHANNTGLNGQDIWQATLGKGCQGFTECCKGQMKAFLGSQLPKLMFINPMMNQHHLRYSNPITLHHPDFIV